MEIVPSPEFFGFDLFTRNGMQFTESILKASKTRIDGRDIVGVSLIQSVTQVDIVDFNVFIELRAQPLPFEVQLPKRLIQRCFSALVFIKVHCSHAPILG
ncbi:hypothetical protein BJH93_10580 [Kocuria polaris]|nr:hypothetical protein [Kocuria polaris]